MCVRLGGKEFFPINILRNNRWKKIILKIVSQNFLPGDNTSTIVNNAKDDRARNHKPSRMLIFPNYPEEAFTY